MRKIAIILILVFVNLYSFAQTTITSDISINQDWISNNPAPWIISGNNVTVTFESNLILNNIYQYFLITGINVTINGANNSVMLDGITNFPGLVAAQDSNASSALIKNIGVNTTNNTSLSSFSGYISSNTNKATIINCFSTGVISGNYTGGITGALNYGTINNCYSTGAISGYGSGGITTYQIGSINNCYSTGVISGFASGGIVGYFNNGIVHNCFSTGVISGAASGGIVCINLDENNYIFNDATVHTGNISNCYTSGEIIGLMSEENPGALVSGGIAAYNLGSIVDCRASGSLSNINSVGVANNNFTELSIGTGVQTNALHVTPSIPNTWDNLIANLVLIGLESTWNTTVSPYTLSSIIELPTFANPGPITICQKGSYFLAPSTTNGTWVSSDPTVATVDSRGYVTGLITGTTTISLENLAGIATATITIGSISELTITDSLAQASYKFNNNPQGPIGGTINYVGYNGYSYKSQIRPTNTGFYRASNQSVDQAGCPYEFYIFRCSTCGAASTYSSRPQGTLIGDTIQSNGIGKLKFISSNDLGGPFTIVYQLIGGVVTTVNHISSGEAFNINAFASTTSFKLISVTDETTKSSTDFSNVRGTILVVPKPTATLTGSETICVGGSANLRVSLTGTGPITVTLNDGTAVTFASGTINGTMSVTTVSNTTYTISSVIDRSGAGTFDGTASVTINNAEPPVIISQPIASITINEGSSTILSVTATGAEYYEWYQGSTYVEGGTSSYTTVNTLSATGTYYVIVYGACSTTVSSTSTTVTVTPRPQGSLTGSTITQGLSVGQLTYTSSNSPVGGPFTIVYQPEGGAEVTITNVTSGVPFDVESTPFNTTNYTLISVTDESSTLSRSVEFTTLTATITVLENGFLTYLDVTYPSSYGKANTPTFVLGTKSSLYFNKPTSVDVQQ